MTSMLTLQVPAPVRKVALASAPAQRREPPAPAVPKPPDGEVVRALQAKVQQACTALVQAAARLEDTRKRIVSEAEEQMLELAIALAQKAMMQEIQNGRCRIEPLLKEALLRVQGRQDVVVYLNPRDLQQCADANGQLPELGSVQLLGDEVVQRGQCLVETTQGAMISSFFDRFDDITDAVRSPE